MEKYCRWGDPSGRTEEADAVAGAVRCGWSGDGFGEDTGSGEDVNQTEMLQRVFLEPLVLCLVSNPSLEGFTRSQGTRVDLLHPDTPRQGDARLSPLKDKPRPFFLLLLSLSSVCRKKGRMSRGDLCGTEHLHPKADVWMKRLNHTVSLLSQHPAYGLLSPRVAPLPTEDHIE